MRARVVGIGAALTLTACVDGTTPDCSDAAAQCGPTLDGAIGEGGATDSAIDGFSDAPDDVADAGVDAPPSDAGWDASGAADAADARG
jgi:hypothetical protein